MKTNFTTKQWQRINDAIEDMLAEELPKANLLRYIMDFSPRTHFNKSINNFYNDCDLVLEFGIVEAEAVVEIVEGVKRTKASITLECTRARFYDYDRGYIDMSQELCKLFGYITQST